MPSKRQQADAAYERAEDQRALALVVHLAETMALVADATPRAEYEAAIARVRSRLLSVGPIVPVTHDVLPGQLDIEGRVAGEPARNLGAPMAEAFDVPKQCPGCGENMLLVWGGSWTPLHGSPYTLQCGFCAHLHHCTQAAYEAVQAERRRTIGESDRKPAKAAVTGRADAKRGAR
jgi:hypothetical protein